MDVGNHLWLESFGDSYHDRNVPNEDLINKRMIFFSNIFNIIKNEGSGGDFPNHILEVGAGTGQNMMALERIAEGAELDLKLKAVEPHPGAREQLDKSTGDNVEISDWGGMLPEKLPYDNHSIEMVFTSGVLIHINDDEIIPSMRELYRVSSRYILAMEYFAPEGRPVELDYRGNKGALWLRDYGSMYMDNFKLKLLGFGFCWKRITQMDNITWFLFEKVN